MADQPLNEACHKCGKLVPHRRRKSMPGKYCSGMPWHPRFCPGEPKNEDAKRRAEAATALLDSIKASLRRGARA